MSTQQPKWKFIANLGDANPLDYGGYFIYKDTTGVYPEEGELLQVDNEDARDEKLKYTVYRFGLDRLKMVDGYLVPIQYEKSWPNPLKNYDEWFHRDLAAVAQSIGSTKVTLEEAFCSPDPLLRAEAYLAVGQYHGMDNLDSYPLKLNAKEAKARYRSKPWKK